MLLIPLHNCLGVFGLKAVNTAKGASTKYCVKGLSTYVNVIFLINSQKCLQNQLLLCHYGGIVCALMRDKNDLINFRIRL